jgi:hypothetical protein
LSKEDIKKRLESDDFATSDTTSSDKYLSVPNRTKKIPFNRDLKNYFKITTLISLIIIFS